METTSFKAKNLVDHRCMKFLPIDAKGLRERERERERERTITSNNYKISIKN
jgi:hypothetical protein